MHLALLLAISLGAAEAQHTIPWSNGKTLRIDLHHTKHGKGELFGIIELRAEGPWPGTTTHLTTDRGLGDYRYSITDARNNVIYRSGFNSNFDDAFTIDTIRIPYPNASITLTLRDTSGTTLLTATIDPATSWINHAPPSRVGKITTLQHHGPSANHVDLTIIGDGYTSQRDFLRDARRAQRFLFSTAPYREHQDRFNIRALFIKSQDNGITNPLTNTWRNTPLGATYNAQNVERRIDITRPVALRDLAAATPYDYLLVITNTRRYGGSAAYQRYAVLSMKNAWAHYLIVHELAHHLAGLADEYYTLASCEPADAEPWNPNITTNGTDPKWHDLITSGTPLPTPWNKDEYTTFDAAFANTYFQLREQKAPEQAVDDLITKTLAAAKPMLASSRYAHHTGTFEGAANTTCGMYRPATDCTMFTLRSDHFCSVCRQALISAIEHETR